MIRKTSQLLIDSPHPDLLISQHLQVYADLKNTIVSGGKTTFRRMVTARQIYGSTVYIYKAKNCKLLVLFTHAQKTKFIFK
jgi:hypothetical protein